MFSMSLRLWAGSMSFSRLDRGNLFQQRAEGSEPPCHVVIRQRAHTGKREGCIQISDQRRCPSKRSSLRLLPQTPLRVAPASPPPARGPPRILAFNCNSPARCLRRQPGTPGKESPAGVAGGDTAVPSLGEAAPPILADPCEEVRLAILLVLRVSRGCSQLRGSSCRHQEVSVHPHPSAAAAGCQAVLCRARLCPAVPSRARRREQSFPKLSPRCLARHPLLCILYSPAEQLLFFLFGLRTRGGAGVGLVPGWVPTPCQAARCCCPMPIPHQDPGMHTSSLAAAGSEHGHSEGFFPTSSVPILLPNRSIKHT